APSTPWPCSRPASSSPCCWRCAGCGWRVRSRPIAFAVIGGICVVAAVVTAAVAVGGAEGDKQPGPSGGRAARPGVGRVLEGGGPFVVARSLDRANPANYGRLAVAPLVDGAPGKLLPAGRTCQRVTFRAGEGICLDYPGPPSFSVSLLDARLR